MRLIAGISTVVVAMPLLFTVSTGTAAAAPPPPTEATFSPTFTDSPVQIVFCLAPGACRL